MEPYYERDGITIYLGDCLEVLPDLRADVIVTDPPFFLPANIHAGGRQKWPRTLAGVAIMEGFYREAFTAITKILKPSGGLYTFCDSTSYAVFLSVLYPLFDRTQCIVWDKRAGGLGNGWRHGHELIVHGAWSTTEYAPGFRRDVLSVAKVPAQDRSHPSEKPIDLMAKLISAHPEGGVILDPFMGSGATLRAAKNLGRPAIGIEIEERYCEIAAERLSQTVLL